ncbi:Os04g0184400 [Oryza sativa Japonica Group]|uniref:Os04g0184400 protein n=1 Tax=Oryza sativa subsp. japonica TaxID=39947 RepID=A0A0P0W720_ORYSJ|nr:Os04g0184400 [Oryza sativa Japonica Group]
MDAHAASGGAGRWPWWAADVANGQRCKRLEGERGRGARHGNAAGAGAAENCGAGGCDGFAQARQGDGFAHVWLLGPGDDAV